MAVSKGTLRILSVENVGETFNQQVTRLRYTPRKLAIHPQHNTLIVAEADHAAIPLAEREDLRQRMGVPDGEPLQVGSSGGVQLASWVEALLAVLFLMQIACARCSALILTCMQKV